MASGDAAISLLSSRLAAAGALAALGLALGCSDGGAGISTAARQGSDGKAVQADERVTAAAHFAISAPAGRSAGGSTPNGPALFDPPDSADWRLPAERPLSAAGPRLLPPVEIPTFELVELPSIPAPARTPAELIADSAAAAAKANATVDAKSAPAVIDPQAEAEQSLKAAPEAEGNILAELPAATTSPTLAADPEAGSELQLAPRATDGTEIADDAAALMAETTPMLTGSPTGAIVCQRAEAKIRRGYALAQRGANFAARTEFVDVLRLIAQAKDQKHGSPRRTVALANGLRALDEAADFHFRGAEFDAQANVAMIVSSHRTPVGKSSAASGLMPSQLADLYYRYAQLQLGASVAGEPVGSMALHALGKLYSQLGRTEPEHHPLAERSAFTLQQAAILARRDNYLAAHELGVLLAESGHYQPAEQVLSEVAAREPNEVVLRNLARVQRKLGREQLANATEQQAKFFASRDGASSEQVRWVNPAALTRTADATAPAMPPAAAPTGHPYGRSPTSPARAAMHGPPAFRR